MLHLLSLHHVQIEVAKVDDFDRFANSFGFIEVQRTGPRVYFRTRGVDAYSLVIEAAPSTRLRTLAFAVASRSDLEVAVSEHGASPIEALDGPGGGEGVRLRDPEGNEVLLVHGIEPREPDPVIAPQISNHPASRQRFNAQQTYPRPGPSHLLRLGHVGLFIRDFESCERWYRNVLGLVPSDRMYAGDPKHFVGGFYRLDRGQTYVDHHVLAFFAFGKTEVHHMSFEVPDAEHQFVSHRHLGKEGWEPVWGVGRHPLGSHVFDVWKDPNGLRFETFTDTDLVNKARQAEDHPIEGMEMDLWSNEPAHKYFA